MSEEASQIVGGKRKMKGKRQRERYIQLNAEFQRMAKERRKPSQVINAKKLRKAIQWERSENSSRKSEIPREHFCKDGHNKGHYGPKRSRRY